MALQRVDELDPSRLQLADRDGATVVPDEDVLSLLVILQGRAPGVAQIPAQSPASGRAVVLEVVVSPTRYYPI